LWAVDEPKHNSEASVFQDSSGGQHGELRNNIAQLSGQRRDIQRSLRSESKELHALRMTETQNDNFTAAWLNVTQQRPVPEYTGTRPSSYHEENKEFELSVSIGM
jgi:hypothetical protein